MSLQYLSGVGDLGRVKRKRKKIRLFKRRKKKVEEEQAPAEQAPEQAPEQAEESLNDMRIKKLKVKRRIKRRNEESEQEPEQEQQQEQEQEQEQQNEENMSNESEGMGLIYPGVPTPINLIKRLRRRRQLLKHLPIKRRRRILHATSHNVQNKPIKHRTFNPHSNRQYYIHSGLPLRKNLIHPQLTQIGRTKGKLKARLKARFKKIIDRRKNDKHSTKQKIAHMFAKQALFIPRGAFLGILLLGKALQKTPIKINLAKKIKQNWATKGNQIKEIWYKMGGEPDILIKQIEKANNAKLSGNMGVVATAGIGAAIASATPIILKMVKLFGKAKEFADKNPKLVAMGQAIVKKGIDKVAKKNGKVASTYSEAIKLADDITSVLPPETQAKINKVRKKLPNSLVINEGNKAVEQVKEVTKQVDNENPNLETQSIKDTTTTGESVTPKSKTMLYVGLGATALVGAYFLTKKK
jgi:hypothetical protein